MELRDVDTQSLVPEPLQKVESVAEFMDKLPEYDAETSKLVEEAASAGQCLRFVGEDLTCRVSHLQVLS